MIELIKQGAIEAYSQRGSTKGYMKAKCPPVDTLGAAVWQGLIGHVNPFRMGICHLLFLTPKNREVYDIVDQMCAKLGAPRNQDEFNQKLEQWLKIS